MNEYLPLKAQYPIEVNEENFWKFYACQFPSSYIGTMQVAAFDALFFAIEAEICAQFDLIAHRIQSLSIAEDSKSLDEKLITYIKHHEQLYS